MLKLTAWIHLVQMNNTIQLNGMIIAQAIFTALILISKMKMVKRPNQETVIGMKAHSIILLILMNILGIAIAEEEPLKNIVIQLQFKEEILMLLMGLKSV